ncbi:mechanosensitive ion channel family protein [Mucilaginibacter yixingensis]|nr:mechanosensitive ion channel family protein [Mucilaginibacter yixingensis]
MKLFLFAVLVFIQQPADTLPPKQVDAQLLIIQRLSAERATDSLRRQGLEQQVAKLSGNDAKRLALLRQLDSIKASDSTKLSRQKQQVDSLRKFVKGYPVVLLNDTLFSLYARQGSFTAIERASAVESRIKTLASDRLFTASKLQVVNAEQTTDLVYGDQLILSLSTTDGLWGHLTKEQLARKYHDRIIQGLRAYEADTQWSALAKEAGLALAVILVAILLITLIIRMTRRLERQIQGSEHHWFGGLHIRNYELVNSGQARQVLSSIVTLVKWLLIILVVYFAIPIVFGFFPYTRELSGTLFGYVMAPLHRIGSAIWAYIPNLITILVLCLVFRYALRFLRFLKREIEHGKLSIPGFYPDWANPTYQIIRVLVLAFMLIVIFPYLPGSDSPIFKGVSVFMGVLFTFGSAGALGNVVAGLVLTYMRAFKLGDRVQIGEVTGDVIQKTLLVTRVRTIKNEIISIPNSTVMNNHTVNYSSESNTTGLILHTSVTIGYDAPWRQVHELLINAALQTTLIEHKPKPFVLQTSLEDYYVSYQINAYTRSPGKQAVIYSELHALIQDKFNEAGVEIMSPHYRAVRDGNTTTIPADYLPKDYTPPAFQVRSTDERPS